MEHMTEQPPVTHRMNSRGGGFTEGLIHSVKNPTSPTHSHSCRKIKEPKIKSNTSQISLWQQIIHPNIENSPSDHESLTAPARSGCHFITSVSCTVQKIIVYLINTKAYLHALAFLNAKIQDLRCNQSCRSLPYAINALHDTLEIAKSRSCCRTTPRSPCCLILSIAVTSDATTASCSFASRFCLSKMTTSP